MPGDSPMGFRLPLDSLPWAAEGRSPRRSTSAIRSRRAAAAADGAERRRDGSRARHPVARQARQDAVGARQRRPRRRRHPAHDRATRASRRAASRPPDRPHRAVRRAARRRRSTSSCRRSTRSRTTSSWSPPSRRRPRALGMRVLLEGYPPPSDPRLPHFLVTPDPGVIEVNVQPAAQLGRARRADDDALRGGAAGRASRPRSSCSTAATPAPAAATTSCSAARRRPTARSCAVPICCAAWSPTGTTIRRCRICSPGCSSGRRARRRASTRRGTTASTSSRSRSRSFRAAGRRRRRPGWSIACSGTCWSTSPATRTAPSSASTSSTRPTRRAGRRGLLELRAFEMPPHARMSLAQQLLLRALVARFWREPYTTPLDALGHRAARPLHAAVLRRARLRRRARGAAAGRLRVRRRRGSRRTSSSGFRWPASCRRAAIHLTLRQALEPWHVLGEEGAAGGTARYVDSSVERLQVLRRRACTGDRYVVTCNGRAAAAAPDGAQRRVRRRRALPRLAAAVVPAPDDSGPRAADVRHRRHLDGAVGRRLQVPRDASGRPQLRAVPGEQLRGREPAPRAVHAASATRRAASWSPAVRSAACEFPYTLDLRTAMTPRLPSAPRRCAGLVALLSDYRVPDGPLRRAARRRRARCGQPWRQFASHGGRAGARRARRRPQARVARQIHENGVTYNVYADRRRPARPWALDVLPADRAGRGVGAARARPAAARAAAERGRGRPLRRRRRCCATGCCRRRWSCGIPASCARVTACARRAASSCTSSAFDLARGADGAVARGRHPHAGAVRRRLRAREPRHHLAPVARRVPRAARPRARAVLPRRCVRRCSPRAPADGERAARRAAHARPVQRDLLRARVPRPVARLPARRGRRPDGARRPRLPEDRLGPAARPRDPAPPRRRLLRSARAAADSTLGVPGSCRRGAPGTCSSPTRSA